MLEVEIKKELPGFSLDVAFTADEETLGIVGHSGSGKTMTLQCIAGLVRPDKGRVKLNGRVLFNSEANIDLPSRNRKIGVVFQNYALFPHLTAGGNIAFGIPNRAEKEKRQIIEGLCDKLDLLPYISRFPAQLSAGQQQRVAIARALAPEPELLLLDEPFSALDTITKEQMQPHLLKLKDAYKGTILFVTHDIGEAFRLSSRIMVCESGRITQCDEKGRLISLPVNLTVAKLAGFRNLVSGAIAEVQDSSMWINVPGVGRLQALRHAHSCLAAGAPVTIGIKSELIRICDQPNENTVRGVIQTFIEEMSTVRCIFQPAGSGNENNLEVIIPKADVSSYQLGDERYFYFPPEHIIIIQRGE